MPSARIGYKRLTSSGAAATGPSLLYSVVMCGKTANMSCTITNHAAANVTASHANNKIVSLFASAPGTESVSFGIGVGAASGLHVSLANADYVSVLFAKASPARGW